MPIPLNPVLLIVDDEEAIRNALKRFLAGKGYEILTAATGAEALQALHRHKIAGILLDVRLPDVSGVDLVPQLLELDPGVAIIMLTAVNDAASATLCLKRGALEYLTKPVDLAELAAAVERALQRRSSELEKAKLDHWLKEEVGVRTAELRMERANLERISVATLETLVNALEAKDPYLRGHSARVADSAAMVAAEMGLPDDQVESIRTAGRLHDIGKIGIREEILGKQGPLTDEEFDHVKLHPLIGSQILSPLAHLGAVIQFVRSHHERWDGKGYPDGLAGEAIPIGARIIGAVEIYDALTTSRPYQEKMLPELAVERLRDLVGTVLDPAVHRALQAVVARREALVFLDDRRA
ncbi:MAG TPA: HD domain-containing phosphohydrolase [Gemmatimonadales bacterium]|jgi:response regulator RpfG family c-di-GMP phosphodiesterase|nr:HD domain-containing phosphohydrolase [Gemmatimonadales bacterium]